MNKSLWQKVQPHAIATGIFFVISCIYCLPALRGLVVAQYDAVGWQGMAQQSLEFKEKYGRFPLWTNSTFSGMPTFQIAAESTYNITTAHLHHLFTAFLPDPAGLFFLACLGFYILCITLGIRPQIAVIGSVAYAFASYSAIIVAVGHTTKFSSMGYAPAVLAGLILLTQRKYLLGFIVTLVFTTQLFYQNHVQIVYYTLLTAFCLGISYTVQAIRDKEILHLVKVTGIAVMAGIMGVLSFAINLFPTYDYSKETMRGGRSELTTPGESANKTRGGLDKDYAFSYSYGITEILTIAVPRMFGGGSSEMPPGSKVAKLFAEKTGMGEEQADQYAQNVSSYWGPQLSGTSGAVYFGAIICVLFIFGLVFYTGPNKPWIIAATLLGIFLSWGKNFEVFNYFLFDHLPFYNKFRAPSMAMVIPQLTFPLLAALGLNQIIEHTPDKKILWKKFKISLIAGFTLFALLGSLYFMLDYKSENDNSIRDQQSNSLLQAMSQRGQPGPEMVQQAQDFGRSVISAAKEDRQSMYGSDLLRSLLFAALAIGLLYFFAKDKLNKNIAVFGIGILVFIDLIGVDLRYLNNSKYVEKEQLNENFTPTAADLSISQDTSYYRVFNHSDGDPFQLSGATPRTSYLHNSIGGYHPAKLALYNDLIREQLAKGNMQVMNMLNAKYFIAANPQNQQPVVQQNPDALGPAWFVSALKYVNNANEEMRALDDFHPKDTAIADVREKSKIIFAPKADSSASIRLVKNLNDRITYTSSSKTDGLAVFSEIYYPSGWKAFIDGKETPIAKVNYLLRGLSIPSGNHAIEFRFEPYSYILGDRISLIIGILSILILIYGLYVGWKGLQKESSLSFKKNNH